MVTHRQQLSPYSSIETRNEMYSGVRSTEKYSFSLVKPVNAETE